MKILTDILLLYKNRLQVKHYRVTKFKSGFIRGCKHTHPYNLASMLFCDILEKCFVVGQLHESKPWVQFAAEPYGKQFSGNGVHGLLFQETKTESGNV